MRHTLETSEACRHVVQAQPGYHLLHTTKTGEILRLPIVAWEVVHTDGSTSSGVLWVHPVCLGQCDAVGPVEAPDGRVVAHESGFALTWPDRASWLRSTDGGGS